MSNIAKVFIIINFVLSILYMGIAGVLLAQKWDYKQWLLEKENSHQEEIAEKNDKIKNFEAQLENVKVRLRETTGSAISFKAKFDEQLKENEKLQRDLAKFNENMTNISINVKELNDNLKNKDQVIEELSKARDEAKEEKEKAIGDKAAAEEQQHDLEIQLSNLKGDIAEKEKLIQKQQKELVESKQLLKLAGQAGFNFNTSVQKSVDGLVTAIATDPNLPLVMISKGKDDGVEKGYRFTVYRGSVYVGSVTIEEVYKDASAARIDKNMTVKQIQKGDSVTTRIGNK